MAQNQLPPNLDDGELWLPSDMFLSEIPSKLNTNVHGRHHSLSCMDIDMDNLSQHFHLLSLLQHAPPKTTTRPLMSPTFERFQRPSASRNHIAGAPGFFGLNGAGFGVRERVPHGGHGAEPFSNRVKPVYEFHLTKPTQIQVESYLQLQARARVLHRQENRLSNRVFPVSGIGVRGFAKESGGTGVFHPRILNTRATNPSSNTNTNTNTNTSSRMVHGPRNRQRKEVQVDNQQRRFTEGKGAVAVVSKAEDCYYHLPPEIRLPRDWTY
ncbi:uncharacterized protein LOC110810584 [Carica papaya]|uniref:uncharacterized protein LOC110810584 n=1 Tax=Carica papaya TaxID=3649 RepID=UPI000B8C8970|nr:uncharacterized protein LOC110810584 [Carica papaya]